MKQAITRNDKNLKFLNELVVGGIYNGYVEPEKFELMRNRFPNNHRLIGILNDEGKFDLKFDFKPPLNVVLKFAGTIGILISIFLMLKGNWLIPIVLIFFAAIFVLDFQLKKKKEINLLTDKLLEFHKTEPK